MVRGEQLRANVPSKEKWQGGSQGTQCEATEPDKAREEEGVGAAGDASAYLLGVQQPTGGKGWRGLAAQSEY